MGVVQSGQESGNLPVHPDVYKNVFNHIFKIVPFKINSVVCLPLGDGIVVETELPLEPALLSNTQFKILISELLPTNYNGLSYEKLHIYF